MTNTLRVRAAPGVRVPKEGRPRAFITDAAVETVPPSAYYLRMVSSGDLVMDSDKKNAKEVKGAA